MERDWIRRAAASVAAAVAGMAGPKQPDPVVERIRGSLQELEDALAQLRGECNRSGAARRGVR